MSKKSSLAVLALLLVSAPSAFAETILPDTPATEAPPDFRLKNFESCSDMRSEIADFMELYYEKQGGGGGFPMPLMREDVGTPKAVPSAPAETSGQGAKTDSQAYSTTNTRTVGVDEPERVKTDGKYLYYVNNVKNRIEIVTADDALNLVNSIKIPESYSSVEIFLSDGKLVVIGAKSSNRKFGTYYWVDHSMKTAVAVYDLANIAAPTLDRYFEIDGNKGEARIVDGELTFLSTTSFYLPYDRYVRPVVNGTSLNFDTQKLSNEFAFAKLALRKVDMSRPKISLGYIAEKKLLRESLVANCSNISYVLPDEKTLENYSFTPSFTAVTVLDLRNPNVKAKTKLLFGDVSKMYLTANSTLYLTSTLYSSHGYNTCPPGAYCILRWIEPGSNTIVHKFSLSEAGTDYVRTSLVPGSLLSDYAIDEDANENLRLVTQQTGQEVSTQLNVLSSTGVALGSLTDIAPKERFQSARFIGDRVYLVTFQQIDPLFVLDVSNASAPKILGELKIPGYSTYLHPLDSTHLIGLGYDTVANNWGGTSNGWLKVDVYDVADVTKPARTATHTIGGAGSFSEALSNPRLFTYYKEKNMLFLPATVYTPYSSTGADIYRYKDVFQGVVGLFVSTGSVSEMGRATSLSLSDEELVKLRDAECKKYIVPAQKICHKIIGGGEVCENPAQYVPTYCYEDSSIGEYKANVLWNHSDDFIDRIAYVGDRLFTFAPSTIMSIEIPSFKTLGSYLFGSK